MTEADLAASRRAARPWTIGGLLALLLALLLGVSPAVAATGPALGSSNSIRDQAGWHDDRDPVASPLRRWHSPRPQRVSLDVLRVRPAAVRRAARTEPRPRQLVRRAARQARTTIGAKVRSLALLGPARVTLGIGSLFTTQFDGSPYANGNCNMAAGAMLFEVQTGRTASGAMLRRWSGARTRGTNLADLRRAFARQGQRLEIREDMRWESFVREVRRGRSAVVQGWYGTLPGNRVLQAGFTTGHSVFVLGYSRHARNGRGAFYVMDPLGSGAYDGHWWSAATLRRFGWSGSPGVVGDGRRAFHGNVALQAGPTYKNVRARKYRPAFQSYWDTSKALLQRARSIRLVRGEGRTPSRVVRVSDPKLRLTRATAADRNLTLPLTRWRPGRDVSLERDTVVARAGRHAKVVAAANGRVVYRAWRLQGGMTLWVQHGPRLFTVYRGLDKVRVTPGQWVKRGRVLGRLATTRANKGRYKGEQVGQLRFSVAAGTSYKRAHRINPVRFLPGGRGAID